MDGRTYYSLLCDTCSAVLCTGEKEALRWIDFRFGRQCTLRKLNSGSGRVAAEDNHTVCHARICECAGDRVLRQCKMLMGEMLSIPEAFVALGNSGVILLIIPILFLVLMADFPQSTGIDRFYQMRCTKRTWIFGQAVFGQLSCFVLLFLLVSSCVLMIGTGRWSLSFSDAVTHFTSVYPDRTGDYVVRLLPGNLYQQMTLEQALIHTFCLFAFIFSAHIICLAFFRLSAITDMWGYS